MPVLSSFISYRPGRKTKSIKSTKSGTFSVRQFDPSSSPHPYASSTSRILDINDGGVLAPNRGLVDGGSRDFYRQQQQNASQPAIVTSPTKELPLSPSPQVHLEINDEPLTDWFHMIKSDAADRGPPKASGSGTQHQDANSNPSHKGLSESQESSGVEEDGDGEAGDPDLSSAEDLDVLAGLVPMDVCHILNFQFSFLTVSSLQLSWTSLILRAWA